MAHELLRYWVKLERTTSESPNTDEKVTHTLEHDLESFIWVFTHSILRKMMTLAADEKDESYIFFKIAFKEVFGQNSC